MLAPTTWAVRVPVARLRAGLKNRVAVFDVRHSSHAVKQRAFVPVGYRLAAEVNKLGVDIMRWDRGGDAVEPGLVLHGRSL